MNDNKEIDISECDDLSIIDFAPQLETPLNRLTLSPQYQKLIKRISRSMGVVNTVQDILDIDLIEFSKVPAVGVMYVELLVNLQNELLFVDTDEEKIEIEEKMKGQLQQITLTDEQLESLLCRLTLPPQYQKLVKRISSAMPDVNTIQDVIGIDVFKFSQLPSVGKSYVELLINLQYALISNKTEITVAEQDLSPQIMLSKLYVNYGFLSDAEIKQLKKVEKIYGEEFDILNVNTLLNLDKTELAKQVGLGILTLNILTDLQHKIKKELHLLPENITEYTIKNRSLFISSEIAFVEFNEIDNVLIEDVEGYLWTFDEMRMDIALSRWGFNQPHETLDEVGSRCNLTRERIRQIEKPINANLPLNFRIQPKVLWANIREKMTEDLTELLPNLAKCFTTEKLFYEFIELCCQVENGSISKIAFTKISSKIINSFFCFNPSPISQEIIINDLMSNYGYSKASAVNGIKQLAKNGAVEITEQGISPKKLGRSEAIAHVLTCHSAGLPWKDIARILNKKGYSSSPFDETRTGHGFNNSEYVYLCGHGTFRHLMFLDFEQFNIPDIMQHLLDYFEQRKLNALHLHDYYQQNKIQRTEIEYFTLRHIVRGYGEEYGVFFNGQSGSDSVSIDKNATRITQADVVVSMLNESKVAMTAQEIAERLRSKSIGHASFYLDTLMKEGRVIRVDRFVYTTPEKAFSKIDVDAVMRIIESVMNAKDTIVDADVFREYVNIELNLSYSKYIYAALVRTKRKELGWYRNNTLFSKNPIPYKNLADMCRQLCNPELSNHENAEILQQKFWLTDSVTFDAIHLWKTQMNQAGNNLVGEME